MFDVVLRDEVEGFLVRLAEADERITAAAVVGSRAHTEGDQWSDIDLTFAVADATAPVAVLDEWAEKLRAQFDGTTLFDLAAGPITYRVFLLSTGTGRHHTPTPRGGSGSASASTATAANTQNCDGSELTRP